MKQLYASFWSFYTLQQGSLINTSRILTDDIHEGQLYKRNDETLTFSLVKWLTQILLINYSYYSLKQFFKDRRISKSIIGVTTWQQT